MHRVQQGHRLPERRQHRGRIETTPKEHQRCDDQHRDDVQLFKAGRPNADDEPQKRERQTGQDQECQHRPWVQDGHLDKQERGRKDDQADDQRLGRRSAHITDCRLKEVHRR